MGRSDKLEQTASCTEDGLRPDYVIQVPSRRLSVWALWAIWVLPPAAVVLGLVIGGRRRKDGERQSRTVRRRTMWALLGGWLTTSVMIMLVSAVIGHFVDQAVSADAANTDRRIAAAGEQQAQERLQAMVDASPSKGKVSLEFCQQLDVVAENSPVRVIDATDTAVEGDTRVEVVVTEAAEATPELVAAYHDLATLQSPNAALYEDYAVHIAAFDTHDLDTQADVAWAVSQALGQDSLACYPLTGESGEG